MFVVQDEPVAQAMRSNRLVAAAQERLRKSPYHAIRNVSCEDRQGAVLLRGHLPSYYLKQVAQETVANLSGLGRVINAIEVLQEPSESVRNPAEDHYELLS